MYVLGYVHVRNNYFVQPIENDNSYIIDIKRLINEYKNDLSGYGNLLAPEINAWFISINHHFKRSRI